MINKILFAIGFTSADLRPEEMNPIWLKEKGDDFFNKENYRAAVNAYTAGIQMNSKMPALYANRASAQFNLQHFNRCVSLNIYFIIYNLPSIL